MLIMVLLGLGAFYLVFMVMRDELVKLEDWMFFIFFEFMGVILAALVGGLLALIVGSFIPTHSTVTSTTELVSLRESTGVEGRFFLLGGYVNSKLIFTYYTRTGENSYIPESLPQEQVIIYEDEEERPYLEHATAKFDNPLYDLIAISSKTYRDAFHIPKNSIKRGFTLGQ